MLILGKWMDKSKETNSTCPVSYVESIPKKQKE
jgi:hypothetical protein